MSQKLPNMLDSTIAKIREMVDVNSVVGEPITTADGVTIIPVSKVSVGFGGGGSDFTTKSSTGKEVLLYCLFVVKNSVFALFIRSFHPQELVFPHSPEGCFRFGF